MTSSSPDNANNQQAATVDCPFEKRSIRGSVALCCYRAVVMERERIKMKYRDGNGDVHDWVEPSPASKRGCMIPLAIVAGIVSWRFWWMLSEPSGINNQAGAHLVAIGGLFGLCIALPATAVLLYAIVGIIKPDWVWREPF